MSSIPVIFHLNFGLFKVQNQIVQYPEVHRSTRQNSVLRDSTLYYGTVPCITGQYPVLRDSTHVLRDNTLYYGTVPCITGQYPVLRDSPSIKGQSLYYGTVPRCRLGNCTFGNFHLGNCTIGKLSFGKC